ncbi:uncharacterized protein A4U43_C08F35590 [Asparagus officinalis]|nr:uncharacterized protein A4U43_C08F35590 [Asparagus officinalis]
MTRSICIKATPKKLKLPGPPILPSTKSAGSRRASSMSVSARSDPTDNPYSCTHQIDSAPKAPPSAHLRSDLGSSSSFTVVRPGGDASPPPASILRLSSRRFAIVSAPATNSVREPHPRRAAGRRRRRERLATAPSPPRSR